MADQNQWQSDEWEITHPPGCLVNRTVEERPSFKNFITIVGEEKELNSIIDFLQYPFKSLEFELPAFVEKESLGDKVLVLNLNTYEMYKTEEGLKVGEWRKFYIPQDYPSLVREIFYEAKRVKLKEPIQFD